MGDLRQYNLYRTYDPNTGRYLEADPLGLRGGPNPFVYVHNLPTVLVDPFGLLDPYQSDVGRGWQIGGNPYDYARKWRSWGQEHFGGPDDSPMRHCVISCMVSHLYGRGAGFVAGLVNEMQGFILHDLTDLYGRFTGKRRWAFDPDDFRSNEIGFDCAKGSDCGIARDDERLDRCVECCRRNVP